MKNILFLCFVFSLIACKKDIEIIPENCSNPINLGDIALSNNSKIALPYSAYQYETLSDENNTSGVTVSINHPDFIDTIVWSPKSSNCEKNDYINHFFLNVEEKYAHFWIRSSLGFPQFENTRPDVLMKVASTFSETADDVKKISESLFVYFDDAFSIAGELYFHKAPAIAIPLSKLDNTATIEDYGYDFYESIVLNNVEYQNVYTNSTPLTSEQGLYVTQFYFSLETGFIGVKDIDDKIWLMDE